MCGSSFWVEGVAQSLAHSVVDNRNSLYDFAAAALMSAFQRWQYVFVPLMHETGRKMRKAVAMFSMRTQYLVMRQWFEFKERSIHIRGVAQRLLLKKAGRYLHRPM